VHRLRVLQAKQVIDTSAHKTFAGRFRDTWRLLTALVADHVGANGKWQTANGKRQCSFYSDDDVGN
jgi:hypothetical protein